MLKPVRPSAALRIKYERRLYALIDEMHASIVHWVSAEWRRNTPETTLMGADETPVSALSAVMRKLARQWLKRFDDLSDSLGDYFSRSVLDRCDKALAADIRKAGFTVRFKMNAAMRDAYGAVRAENVGLIRSIAAEHLARVETLVMQSVSQGRDIGTLTKALEKQFGVTRRRAAFIARDQSNKATAVMRKARETELGIKEGKWLHSAGGKHPREKHVSFSGKRFNLAEGHDFGDGMGPVLPGVAPNCRCTWISIVSGYND